MGQVIEVDFEHGEVLHGVEQADLDVSALWEEYHECVRRGDVGFNAPLLEEGFFELHRAIVGLP